MNELELIKAFTALGQEHLFEHWQDRRAEQKQRLLEDLSSLDLDLFKALAGRLKADMPSTAEAGLAPFPVLPQQEWQKHQEAREMGEWLLSSGKAGFLTVAGGQSSRLGFEGPKGMFPISPIRRAPLFQIFAEKIASARKKYGIPLYWYIMTSPLNHRTTCEYFIRNAYWGLAEEEVIFFSQGVSPSLSKEGKFHLAADGGLFMNPNGHGGLLKALKEKGLLEDMTGRGLEELHYFQVDNPLVNVPDSSFLGFHRLKGSEMSSKVIEKAYPEEKLGTVALVGGKPGIIEYSDLGEGYMYARDKKGEFLFFHGSIAIHILNVAFMSKAGLNLPFHKARKKICSLEPGPGGGRMVERETIKFEMFIFDAIPQAKNALFFETTREEEFAPLKNKTGPDSIETCMQGLIEKYAGWLEQCGVKVPRNDGGRSVYRIEISPHFAMDVETLKNRLGSSVNKISEDTLLA